VTLLACVSASADPFPPMVLTNSPIRGDVWSTGLPEDEDVMFESEVQVTRQRSSLASKERVRPVYSIAQGKSRVPRRTGWFTSGFWQEAYVGAQFTLAERKTESSFVFSQHTPLIYFSLLIPFYWCHKNYMIRLRMNQKLRYELDKCYSGI
jgi:hypothetical protein